MKLALWSFILELAQFFSHIFPNLGHLLAIRGVQGVGQRKYPANFKKVSFHISSCCRFHVVPPTAAAARGLLSG